ncbi:polysaccharide deacetylase family protein [Arhodomonas sp. KWT2]|uniref:polysaccharide deacetylase family protein n=3 Tax=unclassified Arhodomonas TaxID=2621637 RepID=UPI0035BF2262
MSASLRRARQAARAGVCAAARAAGTIGWRRRAPSLLVLTYHRVLPRDDPRWADEQPGMLVSPQTLRMHLAVLGRHFTPVHLADWLDARARGAAMPRRACAITFDDGWRDNYEHAYPVLREMGWPATVFLVSDLIGTAEGFWPERLAAVLRRAVTAPARVWTGPAFAWLGGLDNAVAAYRAVPDADALDGIIEAAKALPDAELRERLAAMEAEVGIGADEPALLDWVQVREMTAGGTVQLGAHTRTHMRLRPDVPPTVLDEEIAGARRVIEAAAGVAAPLFCYPNGDAAPAAVTRVRDAYAGACTTAHGWNAADADPYRLRRVGVHEDIAAARGGFIARVSGWL